ncbi:MAG: hypothetical protein JXB50_00190 [Spirochaetes bacterium]|nr:hypothetical protein [Spirochaetota bacterium]
MFTLSAADSTIPEKSIVLSIVLNIIQRHNGKIWLKSEINKGTTFFIQLPKKKFKKIKNK